MTRIARTSVPGLFVAGDNASREKVAGAISGGGNVNSAWALSSGTFAGRAAARRGGEASRKAVLRNCGPLAMPECIRGVSQRPLILRQPETPCALRCILSTVICSASGQGSRPLRKLLERVVARGGRSRAGRLDRPARNRGTAGHGALVGGHGGCCARRAGACIGVRTILHRIRHWPPACSAADWTGSGSRGDRPSANVRPGQLEAVS